MSMVAAANSGPQKPERPFDEIGLPDPAQVVVLEYVSEFRYTEIVEKAVLCHFYSALYVRCEPHFKGGRFKKCLFALSAKGVVKADLPKRIIDPQERSQAELLRQELHSSQVRKEQEHAWWWLRLEVLPSAQRAGLESLSLELPLVFDQLVEKVVSDAISERTLQPIRAALGDPAQLEVAMDQARGAFEDRLNFVFGGKLLPEAERRENRNYEYSSANLSPILNMHHQRLEVALGQPLPDVEAERRRRVAAIVARVGALPAPAPIGLAAAVAAGFPAAGPAAPPLAPPAPATSWERTVRIFNAHRKFFLSLGAAGTLAFGLLHGLAGAALAGLGFVTILPLFAWGAVVLIRRMT